MDASDPFARALSAPSTLPSELAGLDADPLWAALLTSVQNVVLGEVRRGRHPELADETQRSAWPALLDRLGHDARVRIGREIVDELTVGTVDELWVTAMRVAGQGGGAGSPGVAGAAGVDPDAMGRQAVTSADPGVQERVVDLLELLGEVVDAQLTDRFGVLADESRAGAVEFSLSDAGPAPAPVSEPSRPTRSEQRPGAPQASPFVAPVPVAPADAGLVAALPPALAQPPARPAALPVFDWEPGPGHPVAARPESAAAAQPAAPQIAAPQAPPEHTVARQPETPPGDPGWRPLPTTSATRTPATFGKRAAAFLIDRAITTLIVTAAALLFVWPAAAYASSTPRPEAGTLVVALALVGVAAVSLGWFLVIAWLVGTRGASPGKRIMRIEVVGFSSPGPIGFGRALLRGLILAAFTIGSIVTSWLPYASVFWDSSKQLRGWHDKAVDDIVVELASL
ncbi:hypothetical protein ASF06_07970 [Agreia sp. Leaf244]|uniref:RDD family protein n=1 Tax=Agreia sp. Leaf244 TaxID=1736305 RepID=UPI0006F3D926|nr:RDD family protein [Agreia sp. Leaf244]KQO10131.1 hypothetical protein ASF06_07970 [Agreia sp. Leaf244]